MAAAVALFLAALAGGFALYNRAARRNQRKMSFAKGSRRASFAQKLSRIFAVMAVAMTLTLGAGIFANDSASAKTDVASCGANANNTGANGGNGANSGTNPGTNPAPLGPVSAKDVSFKPTSAMFAGATVTDASGNPSSLSLSDFMNGIPADSPYKTGFGTMWDNDDNPVFYVDDGQLERDIPCDWDCNNDGVVDSHDVYTEWQDGDNKAIIPSISLPVVGDETRLDKTTVDLDPNTPGVQQTVYAWYDYAALKYSYDPDLDSVTITRLDDDIMFWNVNEYIKNNYGADTAEAFQGSEQNWENDYRDNNGIFPSAEDRVAYTRKYLTDNNISGMDLVAGDTTIGDYLESGVCYVHRPDSMSIPYSVINSGGTTDSAKINISIVQVVQAPGCSE